MSGVPPPSGGTLRSDVHEAPLARARLATSADGAVIATTGTPGNPVVIRASAAWAAADGTSIGTVA
ncbi:MAG: hypothetical protein ACRDIL_06820, partial [Candidatus Limnocylindrales bacterium]